MIKIRFFIFIVAELAFFQSFSNDSTLVKGWHFFGINDYEKAREYFNYAIDELDSSAKAESFLALSLMSEIDRSEGKDLHSFMNFVQYSYDPSPWLYALWYRDYFFNIEDFYLNKDKLKLMNNIISSEKANPTIKSQAELEIARHYITTNKIKKAAGYYDKLGSVKKWQSAGRFDNVSGSGFNKEYGPVSHPDSGVIFKGYRGADMRWFDLDSTNGDWVILNNYLEMANSLTYLQTFCESKKEQEVVFRMGVVGSVKVWVNDNLVFSEPEARRCSFDGYSFSVKLNEGYNRILLQIGSTSQSDAQFILRITNKNFDPVSGLSFSTVNNTYKNENSYKSVKYPLFAEEFFLKSIKKHPDKLLYKLMLAKVYLRNDKRQECHKILDDIFKTYENCSYALKILADLYLFEDNKIRVNLVYEKIKTADPDNLYFLKYKIIELQNDSNFVKERVLLNKYEELRGRDKFWYFHAMGLSAAKNEIIRFNSIANEAYLSYPYNGDIVNLKYLSDINNYNIIKPQSYLIDFVRHFFSPKVIIPLIKFYITKDNEEKITKLLDYASKYNPGDPYILIQTGNAYYYRKKYLKAIVYYKKALKIRPFSSELYSKIGKAFQNISINTEAVRYYKESVRYSPLNYILQHKIRKLSNKPDVFDYFGEPDIDSIYQNSADAAMFPDENSIVLLSETQTVVYPQGGYEDRTFLLAKVFNTSGIDIWNNRKITDSDIIKYEIENAEIIKHNGGRVKANVYEGQIVYSSLEPGDAVYLVLRSKHYYSDELIKNFDIKYYFNNFFPVLISKYSLLVPKGTKFKYETINKYVEPVVSSNNSFDLYTWELNEKEKIKVESLMPPVNVIADMLYISNFNSWENISGWYYDVYRNLTIPDYDIEKLTQSLFEGKGTLQEVKKARLIYNYILNNIKVETDLFTTNKFLPEKASIVLSKKSGNSKDIACLFVAMCRAAHLKASVVLVNRMYKNINKSLIPILDFDHIIVKTKVDKKNYFADLSIPDFSFATLDIFLINSLSLDIDKEIPNPTPVFLDPPTRVKNTIGRNGKIYFDENNMIVDKSTYKTGIGAAIMRIMYKNENESRRNERMQNAISLSFPKVKLTTLNFKEGLTSLSDTIRYRFIYKVSNVFTKFGNLYVMKLPVESPQTKIPDLNIETREYPIDLNMIFGIDEYSEEFDIIIPENMNLTELPENISFSCRYASYIKEFVLKADTLHVKFKLSVKEQFVGTDGFKEFKSFIENVVESDSQQIAFKKL